jgi:hypothetical protein
MQVAPAVHELASVLEHSVLPCNKYTRRSGGLRGQSLYMPGLMRAIQTDWTYKRIFAVGQAGA